MIVDISNKVVVITGSSKGIGRELALYMAMEGADIVVNYNYSKLQAEEIYQKITKYNKNCLLVQADITKPEEVRQLYRKTIDHFGKVDILINNAGICDDNLIQMMTLKQWQTVINTNMTGMFLSCREFSKIMIKQNYGKIINIASLKGQEGCAGQVNYSASKAGIIGFTKSLAKELGKYNISVNTICPGFIVSDLNRFNDRKKEIAKKHSAIKLDTGLEDLKSFLVLLSSNHIMGISGRTFNLDSRIM